MKRDREEERETSMAAKHGEIAIEKGSNNKNCTTQESYPNKTKRKFMQKYYHRGPFFQSDPDDPAGTAGSDEIFRRYFSAPTGEDKMDKTILPKVMQVKNFGRRGRTKWTHLVNEDTSDFNSPLSYNRPLSMRHNARMGGMDKL
ncbi:microfibrillar-associated protein 1-like [Chenopodium quinoa]|uniref:microfibrillar-associated protein 1-like n=1 Tax=Chenopodium quinoa TaxID=63459 RepID=UPI000B78D99C|nr:microfibrillar-associated protein 1-like [Chenopodium quinoa]XP_021752471.1 microfibrillar-associated protein 1-like [Chenopodium quinoa]